MRLTEREFKKWHRWLLSKHEKCPLCGRPMPEYKKQRRDRCDADRDSQRKREAFRAL